MPMWKVVMTNSTPGHFANVRHLVFTTITGMFSSITTAVKSLVELAYVNA